MKYRELNAKQKRLSKECTFVEQLNWINGTSETRWRVSYLAHYMYQGPTGAALRTGFEYRFFRTRTEAYRWRNRLVWQLCPDRCTCVEGPHKSICAMRGR